MVWTIADVLQPEGPQGEREDEEMKDDVARLKMRGREGRGFTRVHEFRMREGRESVVGV